MRILNAENVWSCQQSWVIIVQRWSLIPAGRSREGLSPPHTCTSPPPPPPPTLLWATSQYLDIVIRRYRDDRDGGCGNFSFHYLCIGQNGGNIALTVFIHEEGGGRTKQQNLISEVENISVWRKIISTPNIRPLTDVAVTVSWFDYWSILMWYIDINWSSDLARES